MHWTLKQMSPPTRGRPRRRGFTLLELVIVMAVAGILVAVVAPSMTGVTNRESLIGEAYSLSAKISAAREAALQEGRCYAAKVVAGGKSFVVNRMPERNCTDTAPTVSGTVITMTSGSGGTGTNIPGLFHQLGTNQPKLTMAESGPLVWLPNGYIRGDNIAGSGEGAVSDDNYTLTLTDTRLPTALRTVRVVVTAMGLVCVNANGGTACP